MANKYTGIYLNENGTYRVETRTKNRDGIYKKIKVSGIKTKSEALAIKQHEIERVQNSYSFENVKKITFNEVVQEYFEKEKMKLALQTIKEHEVFIKKYILNNIECNRINDLRPCMIASWVSKLGSLNIDGRRKNKIQGFLKSILDMACKKGYLDYKIYGLCELELIKFPVIKAEKREFWEKNEFYKFIDTFDYDDKYKLVFEMLYYSGCRLGELRGLQWQDLNFDNNTILIRRQVTSKLGLGKYQIINNTKTKQDRLTILPNLLIEKLKQYKNSIDNVLDNDFIFFKGYPIGESQLNRVKEKHIKLAGVKYITIHGFRHSYITILQEQGIKTSAVAEMVGHSDLSTTENVYTHTTIKNKDELIKAINNLTN